MRISDWSSDVCSSDLFTFVRIEGIDFVGEHAADRHLLGGEADEGVALVQHHRLRGHGVLGHAEDVGGGHQIGEQIGRDSWRERVCQYVYLPLVADSCQKKYISLFYIKYTNKKH